jgi:rubrerythrin
MIGNVTAAKCVEFAIRTEEMGAELYRLLAEKFAADGELRELFEGLGRDEAHHREQFRALHDRSLSRPRDLVLSEQQENFLRAMSIADVFSSTQTLWKDVDAVATRQDALERALGLEKATLAYYQAMRDVLGKDEVLEALIEVEKSHVVKVMELMITGAEFRGLADRF